MAILAEHPTVREVGRAGAVADSAPAVGTVDPTWLRQVAMAAGADDVGFVSISDPQVADQAEEIGWALPGTRTLLSFVVRMNREAIKTPARSLSNLEFHHVGDEVNEVGRKVVAALEGKGVRGLNPAMGFPMEMDRFPGKIWVVSHKPVAAAAGLGKIGIHRNLIHPRFGSFVLLGTVLIAAEVEESPRELDFNPCLECKLCVAACPVGAIEPDGRFNFSACYTHNYREFMGGFTDWVETVADSKDARDYRGKVTDAESSSVWQSLSFGANYKSAYCLSVCPAGEDVIAPFLEDRRSFVAETVKPLQEKAEPVYVIPGTDAESHARRRFPRKQVRYVGNSLRPTSIAGFLQGLPLLFQSGRAAKLSARYHFTFTGDEEVQATVEIRYGKLQVGQGHEGVADLRLTADGRTWLEFLRKDRGLVGALLRRKIRFRGSPRLLQEFAACFASG